MSDWTIHFGDCRTVLPTLAAGSVHTCVTSPPYYGLRDYGTATWEGGDAGCDHKKPPTGSDPTKGSTLRGGKKTTGHQQESWGEACRKCGARRIDQQIGLEKTPDQYVAELVAVFREVHRVLREDGTVWLNLGDSYAGCKQLLGIPWRVAFALQADGWYLRQDIIWAKPNPMPESVRDRCTKAHEYIFLLAKSARYYYDAAAVSEPAVAGWNGSAFDGERDLAVRPTTGRGPRFGGNKYGDSDDPKHSTKSGNVYHPNGTRNRRSVWTVTPKPFKGAHFATFPPDLIEPCILAGCPVGGTVLDPFNGSGTTGMVAMKHGRKYVGIELNQDYIKMSEERIGKAVSERSMFAAGLAKTGGGVV